MSWDQTKFTLSPKSKDVTLSLMTLSEVFLKSRIMKWVFEFVLQHTSAALSINENWDPDVRTDLDKSLDRIAPEGDFYLHDAEGPDDSVLHIKK